VDGSIDILRQLHLRRLEDLPEMRALRRVHVLLTLFRQVGREGFVEQLQIASSALNRTLRIVAREALIPESKKAARYVAFLKDKCSRLWRRCVRMEHTTDGSCVLVFACVCD